VHPNGKFVYLTNRTFPANESGGRENTVGGEDGIAVFSVNEETGEPNLIQNIDGRGVQLRTFSIDPSGRMLVAASIMPAAAVTAGMMVFQIGDGGKLALERKYDVDVGSHQQFWSGMVPLP
jgi:6-phosphogluconolactonase (cycloisomerase 2 family)